MQVRPLESADAPALARHLARHGRESGRDGDLIFAPNVENWDRPESELRRGIDESGAKSVIEANWVRAWVLVDGDELRGMIKLVGEMLPTAIHRATLSMGIERAYRGQGWGAKLVETAIGWARAQPTLDWLQLYVFAHNEPAVALYKKYGFVAIGTTVDQFRVDGQSIDDIKMVLRLRAREGA